MADRAKKRLLRTQFPRSTIDSYEDKASIATRVLEIETNRLNMWDGSEATKDTACKN